MDEEGEHYISIEEIYPPREYDYYESLHTTLLGRSRSEEWKMLEDMKNAKGKTKYGQHLPANVVS